MNIYDIGRIYFSYDDIKNIKRRNKSIDNFFSGSFFLGAIDFLLKFLYFLIIGTKKFPNKEKENTKVLFYGVSRNNRLTLDPIIKKMGEDRVISFVYLKSFPCWKLYWHALPHLFELVREIRKADKGKRQVLKIFFPKFWRLYGCPSVINEMLELYEPKVVVMSNDHQEFNRCLLMMCKERGIDTIYVQHASAGTNFPPLQFSYSLLDGKDAYNKYNAIGDMQGNIYLMGGVRFDVIRPSHMSQPRSLVIGVAINVVDNEEFVKRTCKELASMETSKGKPTVLLRPHPMMREQEWINWCNKNGITCSLPSKETSFEFIGKVSLLIANQSSIHLDAAMCHKMSVIYNMSSRSADDIYLYKKYGLTKEITSIADLRLLLEDDSLLKRKTEAVQYFNCSYNCPYEGNVAEIISHLINCILNNEVTLFNEERNFKEVENGSKSRVYVFVKRE